MHSDVAISIENLTKTYRLFSHPGDRIKQFLGLGLKQYHQEFTALKNATLNVEKGTTVGIIGRNGSGKSTLLQIVCGILKPTNGTVRVRGRISALLELGAGFNPEFTGRENVYFQGAILGIPKAEMSHRFDQIVAFAEIGAFIDQPVRVYSSGMYLRLAFATAVSVDPDILIVDEALAVGDASFRARCFRRIGELRDAGCTILFVSHDMEQVVKFCNQAVLLDDGEILAVGSPEYIVRNAQILLATEPKAREAVRQDLRKKPVAASALPASPLPEVKSEDMSPTAVESYDSTLCSTARMAYEPNGAVIDAVRILTVSGQRINQLLSRHSYRCVFRTQFKKVAANVRFAVLIKTTALLDLGGAYSAPTPQEGVPIVEAGSSVEVDVEFDCVLNPGTYFLSVSAFGSLAGIEFALHGISCAEVFRVIADSEHSGISNVNFGCHTKIRLLEPSEYVEFF